MKTEEKAKEWCGEKGKSQKEGREVRWEMKVSKDEWR